MDVEYIEWNEDKDRWLRQVRGISFERVTELIFQNKILDIVENPNQEKYPGQRLLIIEIDNYVYIVPFVKEDKHVFLKTIIPSRKATRKYLGKE